MPNPFTLKTFKTFVWEAVYIIFLSIILANYWVGFYLGRISILPLIVPLTYFMASICGFLAYLFIKSIRRAFYATILICVLACIITALSLFMPAYHGVVDMETESCHISGAQECLTLLSILLLCNEDNCHVTRVTSPRS